MKTRVLELHPTRTVCAMLALASLLLSLAPRPARASVNATSKRIAAVAANNAALDDGPAERARVQKNYGALPLSFEANRGQTDRSVRFLARADGYNLFGDGIDTIGVFNPLRAEVSLRNFNSAGVPDITPFFFGLVNTRAFAGDWNGDGIDTIGNFSESANLITLRNSNTNDDGIANFVITGFGQAGDLPLGGDWDGRP